VCGPGSLGGRDAPRGTSRLLGGLDAPQGISKGCRHGHIRGLFANKKSFFFLFAKRPSGGVWEKFWNLPPVGWAGDTHFSKISKMVPFSNLISFLTFFLKKFRTGRRNNSWHALGPGQSPWMSSSRHSPDRFGLRACDVSRRLATLGPHVYHYFGPWDGLQLRILPILKKRKKRILLSILMKIKRKKERHEAKRASR
jgi:hypothetical protein